jgi:hypothetical protein
MVGKLTNQLRSLFRSKTPSDAQSAQAAAGIPVAIPSHTAAVSTGDTAGSAPSVSESGAIHLNSSLLEVEPSSIPPIPVPNATASAPPPSPPAAASPGPPSEWDEVLARARARIPNKRS